MKTEQQKKQLCVSQECKRYCEPLGYPSCQDDIHPLQMLGLYFVKQCPLGYWTDAPKKESS